MPPPGGGPAQDGTAPNRAGAGGDSRESAQEKAGSGSNQSADHAVLQSGVGLSFELFAAGNQHRSTVCPQNGLGSNDFAAVSDGALGVGKLGMLATGSASRGVEILGNLTQVGILPGGSHKVDGDFQRSLVVRNFGERR